MKNTRMYALKEFRIYHGALIKKLNVLLLDSLYGNRKWRASGNLDLFRISNYSLMKIEILNKILYLRLENWRVFLKKSFQKRNYINTQIIQENKNWKWFWMENYFTTFLMMISKKHLLHWLRQITNNINNNLT